MSAVRDAAKRPAPAAAGKGVGLSAALASFDARIPFARAVPYGLQHVLAMFVANLAPIAIVCSAAGFDGAQTAMLIQNAMVVAAIGTLVQLFGPWRVGARLPIVMGVSFTFVTVLCGIAAQYGYGAVVGAVIAGGVIEGLLGLFAQYWRRFIKPVVSGVVVTSIGFSLLSVGATSFAGGAGAPDLASPQNLFLGTVSLIACLAFQSLAKGTLKQLAVLFGLAVGYVVALVMGRVDFSVFEGVGVVSLPAILPVAPEFQVGAIVSVVLLYLVSAAETMGDTSAVTSVGFGREATEREYQGAVAADGFTSALSGVFGCTPLTSFAQNIGLISMTRVVNRTAIAAGAGALLLAGLVPVIGAVFSSLPHAVLGGCTIMMFGSIIVAGFQMIANAGFTQRNVTIAATSLAIGIGFTQVSDIFMVFPEAVRTVFMGNSVALAFVVAVVMANVLPKNMQVQGALVASGADEGREGPGSEGASDEDGEAGGGAKAPDVACSVGEGGARTCEARDPVAR
ncbi:purine permease [Eggerthellaceae bacterium zg-997]|nr:purine permease [Eggerthellaceae bacterium zg-997]